MMTLKEAIEILQAVDGAESIEMTRETKEAIETAEAALTYIDMHDLDRTPVERRITF